MNRTTLCWLAAGIAAGIALGLHGFVGVLSLILHGFVGVLSLILPLSILWVVIVEGPERPSDVDHRANWRKWQEEIEILRSANGIRPIQRSRKR
jgi:hypothetical protein